jgi:hypothetical protein
MVLTVSFVLSSVTGLIVTVAALKLSARLDASAGASGPHDFAVRDPRRSSKAHPRPPHPIPTFVTMANAPLPDGMARNEPVIWVKREADYFCAPGWTGQISLKALRKITPARTSNVSVSSAYLSALLRIPDSRGR